MFLDITHYKTKRKGKRGPIPMDGEREAAGRLSRAAQGGEHMVYFVALDNSRRIKVGRTRNITQRLKNYRHAGGSEARCLAQLIVAGVDESKTLETAAIHYLQARYERVGREWFEIPEAHLAQAISEIIAQAGVQVERRGAPGAEQGQMTSFQYSEMSARKMIARKGSAAVY